MNAIVSCGTLSLELKHLRAEGFLDTEHLFFTTPGLHEDIPELERQLLDRITKARQKAGKVLVVYGGKFCYVNADEPTRTMQQIITEQGSGVARIQATHCMDMLASEAERERIAAEVAGGEKVWWMTPGWMGIPITPFPVSLDRFKMLLAEQAEKLHGNGVQG